MIAVERVPVTCCIQVHNVDESTKDTLPMYLENPRHGGGGTIRKVIEVNLKDKYALYEFENSTGEFVRFHLYA